MSADAVPQPQPHADAMSPAAPAAPAQAGAPLSMVAGVGLLALLAIVASAMTWQRLSNMQEQLARQSAQAGSQSVEARALAKDAQDMARDSAARASVLEARVAELALQRTQLEELMQSMSRSRDENLVADVESTLRLALQQAGLSGSIQPLVAALQSSRLRIERAAQPRLAPVIRAIDTDLDHLSRMSVTDTAGVLARIEDLTRQVDELPLASDVGRTRGDRAGSSARETAERASRARRAPATAEPEQPGSSPLQWVWWQSLGERAWNGLASQTQELVRVRRIDAPEAALVAPEQAYFLRENLKLQLLNARLALLSRQGDTARADLSSVGASLHKYFDGSSRRTQIAQAQLQQILANLRSGEQPKLDETLSALATAAAGR